MIVQQFTIVSPKHTLSTLFHARKRWMLTRKLFLFDLRVVIVNKLITFSLEVRKDV